MHISKILILLINLQLIFLFFQDRRVKLYKKDENFYSEDVIKKLSIVLADGIYVDTLNLKLRIQNQIRRLAASIGISQELSIYGKT